MFIIVKVITMTGRFSMFAKTALTMPKPAPRRMATKNERKMLCVEFQRIPAQVAHIRDAGPSDISKDPLE